MALILAVLILAFSPQFHSQQNFNQLNNNQNGGIPGQFGANNVLGDLDNVRSNNQQNTPNNQLNPFSQTDQFGNAQSPRVTQYNYNSLNWNNVDRRAEEQWTHLYPFGERYWDDEIGRQSFGARPWHDRQIDLDFFLPYYGFRFNYTFIFPEGFLAFSYPWYIQPPYEFPVQEWPERPDPSLIAAFMSPSSFMHVGDVGISRVWFRIIERPNSLIQQRRSHGQQTGNEFQTGSRDRVVYRRPDGSPSHTTFGSERLRIHKGRVEDPDLLNTISNDIHNGMVGARGFLADYALLITWERMGYGGAPKWTALDEFNQFKRWQNTFQMLVATDEIRTYTMFNFANINWTSSTSAGSLSGRGGRQSGLVGFNGGNGTGWVGMPYSGIGNSYKLTEFGATPTAGRWLARVDEEIQYGGCTNNTKGTLQTNWQYLNMMGGFAINVSGPCFRASDVVKFQIDKPEVDCRILNMAVARCVIPVDQMRVVGRVGIALSTDGGELFPFINWVYLMPHVRNRQPVQLVNDPSKIDDHWSNPDARNLTVRWEAQNLTYHHNHNVDIVLWGYWENTLRADLQPIGYIAENIENKGSYFFDPKILRQNLKQRIEGGRNSLLGQNQIVFYKDAWKKFEFGMVEIRVHGEYTDSTADEFQYSEITPFPWYFKDKWEEDRGDNWALDKCTQWFEWDGKRENFVMGIEEQGLACPCTLEQARLDVGRFLPLYNCDELGDRDCPYHSGAEGCYISRTSSPNGAMQTCCFDKAGWLMFTQDYEYNPEFPIFQSAGGAQRANIWGSPPMWRPPFIAAFSHYYNDVMPWQMCCRYTTNCELYYWRRETSTCQNYRPPAAGFAFGEPHFITYDGTRYTFNGKGYYVLSAMKSPVHDMMVQVRMEEPPPTIWNQNVRATVITGVAMQDNSSDIVQIFARKEFRRWRYKMDIYVNNERVFFDREYKKYQLFSGLSILSPNRNFDTSELTVMFETGVGVRVRENRGILDVMVVIPPNYNETDSRVLERKHHDDAKDTSQKIGRCDGFYRTFGLLGAWNKKPEDDLETVPQCSSQTVRYPPDEGMSQTIFDNFGQKYKADGTIFGLLFNNDFLPIYNPLSFSADYQRKWIPVMEPRRAINQTSAFVYTLPEVEVSCQGSYACLYDYILTGRREIAMDTLKIEREGLRLKAGEQWFVSCGPLQKNRGIIKFPQGNNYLDGVTVRLACQPEYYIHGDPQRTCQNGTWSPGWWTWCRDRTEEWALKYTTGILVSLLIIGIIAAIFTWCYCVHVKGKNDKVQRQNQNRRSVVSTVFNTQPPPPQQITYSTYVKNTQPVFAETFDNEPKSGSNNALRFNETSA